MTVRRTNRFSASRAVAPFGAAVPDRRQLIADTRYGPGLPVAGLRRTLPAATLIFFIGMLAVLLPVSAASVEAPVELSSVLAATRIEPPARVRFSELRSNPLFDEPLELEGYVEYLAPGVLRKVIESPFQESFLIDSGRIVLRKDGETRQLSARSGRALATILEAIEAILSGRDQPLRSVFDCDVVGSATDWQIKLTPKARRMARHLSGVSVSGDAQSVNEIRTDLEGGESHVMRLLHEAPQQ